MKNEQAGKSGKGATVAAQWGGFYPHPPHARGGEGAA